MSIIQSIMNFISAKEDANPPAELPLDEPPALLEPLKGHETMPMNDRAEEYAKYAEANWVEHLKDRSRKKRLLEAAKKGRDSGNLNEDEYKKALDTFGGEDDQEQEIRRQMKQYRETGRITERGTRINEKGEPEDYERDVAMKRRKR